MKFKCLAAALLSSLPLFAHAQTNVTIYGVMDAAIAVENTDTPGEGHRTVINSGNQSSSRIGFRGTEDLGNGLKALFNIEAGVALDTGAADSSLFGRRAVVASTRRSPPSPPPPTPWARACSAATCRPSPA
jgi:predicted porin